MMLLINADARDATAHHYVCLGYPEIVPVLIECGTDINARGRSDWTQLDDVSQDWHLGL